MFYTLIKIVNLDSLLEIFDKKLTKLMIPNLCSIFNKLESSYDAERARPVDDHCFSKSICSLAVLDKGTNSETAFIKSFSISSLFSENEMCIPSITTCSSSAPENPSVLSIMVERGKL